MNDAFARIPAIDGLRAVAVGLVFASHALPFYFPGGFIGVDIFFVISGFVITGALMRDGLDLRRFYLHRFFRIIPPVLPVLAVTLLAGIATMRDAAFALFSVMNWTRAFGISAGGHLGHFWSLAVEEQFYLLWPFALLALNRGKGAVPILAVALAGLVLWQLSFGGRPINRVFAGLDTRGVALLAGCLLFLVRDKMPRHPAFLLVPLMALVPAVLLLRWQSALYLTAGIPLVALLAASAIGHLAAGPSRWHRLLETRLFQWAGLRSYAIYLWHLPVLHLCSGLLTGLPHLVGVLAAVAATFALAEASWHWVERPARSLRARLERRE